MASEGENGRGGRPRRLRVDRDSRPIGDGEGGHSGRRFVTLAVLAVLVTWALLAIAFREWRARYRARADFGRSRVATAIEPMAGVVPPGVAPDDWRRAVAETRAMLVTLTASNLLDLEQMRALGDEVRERVARARPDSARDELAALWDELDDRAGPVLGERHPRPKLLPPKRLKGRAVP